MSKRELLISLCVKPSFLPCVLNLNNGITILHWCRPKTYKPLQIHLYSLTNYSLSGNKHCWFTFQMTWHFITSHHLHSSRSYQSPCSFLLKLLRNPLTHLVFFSIFAHKESILRWSQKSLVVTSLVIQLMVFFPF